MLVLDQYLTLNRAAIESPNLCDRFTDQDLKTIGNCCGDGYDRDEQSRSVWLKRNEAGMDLALQMQTAKTFPWPGCSNVAFPLVTIAAQQFHARAYPAIVPSKNVVKVDTFDSPDPHITGRASRISTHMSWQRLYQDKAWEEQTDKAILNLSIVGTNFMKSYHSPALGYDVSELVLAKDLVLDYWSKSVEACPRKTHKLPQFRNEVYEKVMRGTWRDVLEEPWYKATPAVRVNETQQKQDQRQGVQPPPPDNTSSLLFGEQHVNMDLDNDGYEEPYIITFHIESRCVVRIVTRFDSEAAIERVKGGKRDGKVIRIAATEYFTKKTFIPSPDGGIYDIGFGIFLGPLNEAVNSLVNMLLDAGTLQTTGGGFLGRGAKIRGGVYTVAPFEWKRVDSTGDDLRKSIFPLPVNEPSQVLFQLLGLLIDYTSRVSGTTDITIGENVGQNTPAATAQTMNENGQKIYTAIFKRVWRSTKEEFQKLYRLNGIFLPEGKPQAGGATKADYQGAGDDVCPVADPTITSESMRIQLAGALKQAAATTPGYDHDVVERRWLKAIHVDAPDEVFPGTKGQPPQKDPKLVIVETQEQAETQRMQMKLEAAQQEMVAQLMEDRILTQAKILELQAKAMNESANAQTEEAYAQVAMINAEISRMKIAAEHKQAKVDAILAAMKIMSDHHIGIKGLATKQRAAA